MEIARTPMKQVFPRLTATLLVAACPEMPGQPPSSAPQTTTPAPLPANAQVVGSGPIVMPQQPRPTNRVRGDFTIHTRHLVYVAVPGSLERPIYPNGDGIVV